MKISRFEDIEAWQIGRALTKEVYAVTAQGDFARDFGLRDQIQRASGSIMHNARPMKYRLRSIQRGVGLLHGPQLLK